MSRFYYDFHTHSCLSPCADADNTPNNLAGMCGGCRLTVGGETKFACVDGPDFDGHLVDFDSAMRRGAMYKAQERAAVERREEHCNLFKKEVK